MKVCPFCAEQIQDAAIVCRYCGRDVPKPPPQTSSILPAGIALTDAPVAAAPEEAPASDQMPFGLTGLQIMLGAALLFGLVLISNLVFNPQRPARATPVPASSASPRTPPAPSYALELLAVSGNALGGGYWEVSGEVRNVSGAPMENVVAVAKWYDANGQFITTSDALIDYNPVMPGQASPFKVMTRGNPLMDKFIVEFKTFAGGTITTKRRDK